MLLNYDWLDSRLQKKHYTFVNVTFVILFLLSLSLSSFLSNYLFIMLLCYLT